MTRPAFFSRRSRRLSALFAAVLVAIACAVPALAQAAIPEPTELFYVNDFAGVLEQSTIDELVKQNDELYAKTGAQIVVTTVDFFGRRRR